MVPYVVAEALASIWLGHLSRPLSRSDVLLRFEEAEMAAVLTDGAWKYQEPEDALLSHLYRL
jgi:hypothetical protein